MTVDGGAGERDAIRRMFAGIAPRYDLLNRLLSVGRDRYWRREAVAQAQLPPDALALDVCTGTADIAIELAKQFPSARSIVGVDFCLPMLCLGADKVSRSGLTHQVSSRLRRPRLSHSVPIRSMRPPSRSASVTSRIAAAVWPS